MKSASTFLSVMNRLEQFRVDRQEGAERARKELERQRAALNAKRNDKEE